MKQLKPDEETQNRCEVERQFWRSHLSSVTDVSYKILMSLIGREIENHIAENKIEKYEQAGFTKGRNILDNLFILRECVEETYRKKEQMVAIAIDFKKAYDSIKRETMVQILKELRIDSKIIDFIVRIYRCSASLQIYAYFL